MPANRKEIMQANLHAQVLKLRHDGYTVAEVAAKVGISPLRAHVVIDDAIKELQDDSTKHAAAIKEVELLRLETATKAIMPGVEDGNLGAISVLLKVQDRRAKFLGLDTPLKQDTVITIDVPWLTQDRLAYKNGPVLDLVQVEQQPQDVEFRENQAWKEDAVLTATPLAKTNELRTSPEHWKPGALSPGQLLDKLERSQDQSPPSGPDIQIK